MNYADRIAGITNFSTCKMIEVCKRYVPAQYKAMPYRHPELSNGVALLKSDAAMDAYIASYGEMHMIKCRAAMQNFPYNDINGSIEIVDWGCGQGIGSMCVYESLEARELDVMVKKITIVEPSSSTISRAYDNINKLTGGHASIKTINDFLPGNNNDGLTNFQYTSSNVIHVFSNILDVTSVSLTKMAEMVATLGRNHYIVCIGPKNSNANRIDYFCALFGEQNYFSNISDSAFGRTSDTNYLYTCKTKCFKYNGFPLNPNAVTPVKPILIDGQPVLDDYDSNMAVLNKMLTKEGQKYYEFISRTIGQQDIVLIKPKIKEDTPDMVILQPDRGLVIVQLFSDKLEDYHFEVFKDDETQKNYTILKDASGKEIESPLAIIENYQRNLIKSHLNGIVDKRSAFAMVKKVILFEKDKTDDVRKFFDKSNKYTSLFGIDSLKDDKYMNVLAEVIRNSRGRGLSREVAQNLMRIINPEWHSYKEGSAPSLSTVQDKLAVSHPGMKQKIAGVAGSGKTEVLVNRAIRAQVRTGGKVLILTYNVTLANYIKYRLSDVREDFPWSKIEISTYHKTFRAKAANEGIHVGFYSYDMPDYFKDRIPESQQYDAIFVDEVQDYDAEWLRTINKSFLKKDGEFVVFGDPKQNIYDRPTDSNGDILIGGVIGGMWNHQLDKGKRFTNQQLIYLFNMFQNEFMDNPQKIPSVVETNNLMSIKYANIGKINSSMSILNLAKYCSKICKEFDVDDKHVAVLSQSGDLLREVEFQYRDISKKMSATTFATKEDYDNLLKQYNITDPSTAKANYSFKRDKEDLDMKKKQGFTMAVQGMKFSTIHSFKGWDAKTVILIIQPESNESEMFTVGPKLDNPGIIYTAITRARENLFIFNLGNERYHTFFENTIIK